VNIHANLRWQELSSNQIFPPVEICRRCLHHIAKNAFIIRYLHASASNWRAGTRPLNTFKHLKEIQMKKQTIQTADAPQAIGTYSQAIRVTEGDTVYLSGQIGLDPFTMQMVVGIEGQIQQVFLNLKAVATASGGSLSDIVKLNVYLTDLANFERVNEIMAGYFSSPYPARAAIGVAALPRGALVEMDAVMVLQE
jgi:reactive intermediate/imine deaminase